MSLLVRRALLLCLIFEYGSSQISYSGPHQIIFGETGLANSLDNPSVISVTVSGNVTLDGTWTSRTITNRNLTIEGDPNSNITNVLNFGGQPSAIVLGSGALFSFNNVTLQGAGSQVIPKGSQAPNVTQRVYNLGLWPSLVLLNNSAVVFNNASLQYYSQQSWSQCQFFAQKVLFQLQVSNVSVSHPTQTTVQVMNSTFPANVTNTANNQTVGAVTISTINTTLTCVNDPYAVDAPVSGVPPPKGGGFKWWYGLIIGLVVGFAALFLLAGLVFWRVRRRRQRSLSDDPISQSSIKSPPSQNGLGTTSSTRSGTSSPANGLSHMHATTDSIGGALVATRSQSPKLSQFGSHVSQGSASSLIGSHAGSATPVSNVGRITSWAEIQLLLRERSDFSDLEFGPLIGKGSFGRVYKGRWKGAFVAIKIVDHKEAANKVMALREGTLSHSAQHPNVITTYNVFTQQVPAGSDAAWNQDSFVGETQAERQLTSREESMSEAARREGSFEDTGHASTVMILEFADRGTLDKAIMTGRFLDPATGNINLRAIHATLMDIAGGIAYLHSVGVLHGDLKGANVLLKSTTADSRGFTAKLADFGMARLLAENSTHVSTKTYGTISYMPVEVLKHGKLTRAVDSYSFAIIMWELFKGDVLYSDMTVAQLYYKVCCENDKPPVPEKMPREYSRLMQQCWNDDPELRPTSEEILQYLMTLPAHRRVSKESQSQSGSLSSPDKVALRGGSGLLTAMTKQPIPSRAQSSLLNSPGKYGEMPSSKQGAGSKALTTRNSAEIGARSIGLNDIEAYNASAAPVEKEPAPQSRLALAVDLPQTVAKAVQTSELQDSAFSPKQVQKAQQSLSSPFMAPSQARVQTGAVGSSQTQTVEAEAETQSQVHASNLQQNAGDGAQSAVKSDVAGSTLPPLHRQRSSGIKSQVSVQKPPANPFAQASMQFVKHADDSDEPFGARRIT